MATSFKSRQKNLQKYLDRIEYAEQKRDAFWRDQWLKDYKRYRNYVDQLRDPRTGKPVKPRGSTLSIPYSFTMVETVLPRLVETLFAARPYVTLKGLPPGRGRLTSSPDELREMLAAGHRPWEDAAKKMETLIDYQHNVPMDIQDIFAEGLKQLCIYGTAVAYTGWKYSERKITRKELLPVETDEVDPETGEKIPLLDDDENPVMDWQTVEVMEKVYDDPEVQFIDLGLFYVDPHAKDIDDARYCGHDAYVSKAELKEMERQGLIKVDWKQLEKDSGRVNEARNYRMTAVGLPSVMDQVNLTQTDDDLYQLTYYWEDDLRVLILNRCQIVAEGPNPYWHGKKPYDKDVYCEIPGEFYGRGIMSITEDLQDELNVERNQRIDYRALSMRRMWKVRKNASINREQLVWRQDGVIEVNASDDVEALQAPDGALAGSFNQESVIKQDIRDAVGAHDIVMGAGSGGTATEVMARDNNAAIRFRMLISSIEKRLLLGITRKMIQLNQQFIDDIRLIPLFDQDAANWPIISPEEIQGEFHLIPAGSSVEPMANKEAFKQRLVELYGLVSNDPFFAQFPAKRRNLLKKIFEAFDITDTDDILPTDDELAGMLQQQAVQEWIATLPPELQQILGSLLPVAPTTAGEQPAAAPPASLHPVGGAANTAPMQEMGMQMMAPGGVPGG